MSEKRQCLPPFSDYTSFGPQWIESTGRFMITLAPLRGLKMKSRLMPYGRYVYSVVNNVRLSSSLQVDHIDGDRTHDLRSNLQVLTGVQNRMKSMVERKSAGTMAEMVCPQCLGLFYREKRQTHMAKKGEFTACSRKCAGQFRKRLQDARALDNKFEERELKRLLVGNFLRWSVNLNPTGKILVEHKKIVEPWEAVSSPFTPPT